MKILFAFIFSVVSFALPAQILKRPFEITDANVSRKSITTIDKGVIKIERTISVNNNSGDIRLYKKDASGNEEWSRIFGGTGYEYVGSFTQTKDEGFLLVGTTSSYGNGNNNVYLVKTDSKGKELWSKTYGGFFNEYGLYVIEEANGEISVKAKKQFCEGENVGSNCYDKTWFFRTDAEGNILSEKYYHIRKMESF